MDNLTPTEYDAYVRTNGARAALENYAYTLCYRYSDSGHEWTMFYPSEASRQRHAKSIIAIGGRITGASPALTYA